MRFDKYQAAGNDFIIFDNRNGEFPVNDNKLIHKLCDRHFGIGADGLILFEFSEEADFFMRYYNADGAEGSLCGNGSRAIIAWAVQRNLVQTECRFEAYDGIHDAKIISHVNGNAAAVISVQMNDIEKVVHENRGIFLDTGSPHYVSIQQVDLGTLDVSSQGRAIRNSEAYKVHGTNVNFVKVNTNDDIDIRTYERGVEAETLACGTGVTAAVIACAEQGLVSEPECTVNAIGGILKVRFNKNGSGYKNIWLQGPAEFVFSGEIDIER